MPINKFDSLLGKAQALFTPALQKEWGEILGLPAQVLVDLGCGYFGDPHEGISDSLVSPEFNDKGEVIGLLTRGRQGNKSVYKGSRRGLVYILSATEPGQSDGTDLERCLAEPCPLCGKVGECKASDTHVLCAHVHEGLGFLRRVQNGSLHIRGDAARRSIDTRFPDSPVVVVEGFSDCATARGLQFDAVGLPSAGGGLDFLSALVRGRRVLYIGDNDTSGAGAWSAGAAWRRLQGVATEFIILFPPKEYKDLREWYVKGKLTKQQLLEHAQVRGRAKPESIPLPDRAVETICTAYAYSILDRPSNARLAQYAQGGWFSFGGTHWSGLDKDAMCARIVAWSHAQKFEGEKGPEALNLTKRDYGDVLMHLQSILRHDGPVPCWLKETDETPSLDRVVSFRNGYVYLDGSDAVSLVPGDPALFDPAAVPCDLDLEARAPQWMNFLDTSLNIGEDGPAKIALLQEWFGYCLLPTQQFEKMLFMVGPPASGKGTVLDALNSIFGPLFTAFNISDMGGKFGLQLFPGKRVAAWSEATNNAAGDGDVISGFQRLLSIVGGDQCYVNLKGREPWSGPLPVKIVIAANNFLELPDGAGASVRRLLPLEFSVSHAAEPDTTLKRRLRDECAGILAWAVQGLVRLMQRGAFELPESSERILAEWRTEVSPIASFSEECIVPGTGVDIGAMRMAFNEFFRSRGGRPLSNSAFLRMVKNNPKALNMVQYQDAITFPNVGLRLGALRQAGVPR